MVVVFFCLLSLLAVPVASSHGDQAEQIQLKRAFSGPSAGRKLSSLTIPSAATGGWNLGFIPAPESSLAFVPSSSPSEIPPHPRSQPFPYSPLPPPILPFHVPPPAPINPPTVPSPISTPPSPSPVIFPPSPTVIITPAPSQTVIPTPTKGSLWCVAMPTVAVVNLQTAMDYACGIGGADCEAIMPGGDCFLPNTVMAHASYAFNSYWQKMKYRGGTCDFGGNAMLIDRNPSTSECLFEHI